MRELILNLSKEQKPHYLRIADALRHAIREGQVQAGEPVPSARTLARSLGAHRHTVMSALNELIAEGWLSSQKRQAYRVCETLPTSFFEASHPEKASSSLNREWRIARAGALSLPLPAEPGQFKYSFQSGLPDFEPTPV